MDLMYAISMLLFGLCLGSFFHNMGYRLSKKESNFGRSKCNHCNQVLTFYECIPLFSFILLKGKCRYCKSYIKISHFLSEIFMGVLFCAIALQDYSNIQNIRYFVLFSILLCLTIQDLYSYEVSDIVLWIAYLSVFIFPLVQPISHYVYAFAVIGAIFCISSLFYVLLHKVALGGGDIKLFVFLALSLPLLQFLCALLFANVIGIIMAFTSKKSCIPFVPAITLGVALAIFI